MKNDKPSEIAEIEIDELRRIEKAHYNLEKEVHNLKYYISNMVGSDHNIKYSKTVLEEIDRIIRDEIGDTRKVINKYIEKNEDEKRFIRMTKVNSPDKKTIERMGKMLNIRSGILKSAVKTSELKKMQRDGRDEHTKKNS